MLCDIPAILIFVKIFLLRTSAQIVSIVFHPLLIIIYLLMILIALNPYLFALQDLHEKTVFFVYTFVNTLIIPVIAIFIMKMLGIVQSLQMQDKKERIGPLIVIGSLYLWMFINFKGNPSVPELFVSFILGSVLAIFLAFFINNFTKLSLHSAGLGGLVTILLIMKFNLEYDSFYINIFNWFGALISVDLLLIVAIIISGIVSSARLYLGAHSSFQIYLGFIVGIITQLIAFNVIF